MDNLTGQVFHVAHGGVISSWVLGLGYTERERSLGALRGIVSGDV